MPNQVHVFNIRAGTNSGHIRCSDRAEAEGLYKTVSDGIASGSEFISIVHGDDLQSVRAEEVMSFGISVHMEQTREEIRAMQIERIKNDTDYCGTATQVSGILSGNLLSAY